MKSLLIAAHGSRIPESNLEVQALTDQIRLLAGDIFEIVECGFMENGQPGIDELIDKHAEQGVLEIVLFPYLLASGRHVQTDIPGIIESARTKHPELKIIHVPHLGMADGLAELILKHVR